MSVVSWFLREAWAECSARIGDLVKATRAWIPWIPPKRDQAFQQGGALVFNGSDCVLAHYDESTGAHIDLDTLVKAALEAK